MGAGLVVGLVVGMVAAVVDVGVGLGAELWGGWVEDAVADTEDDTEVDDGGMVVFAGAGARMGAAAGTVVVEVRCGCDDGCVIPVPDDVFRDPDDWFDDCDPVDIGRSLGLDPPPVVPTVPVVPRSSFNEVCFLSPPLSPVVASLNFFSISSLVLPSF